MPVRRPLAQPMVGIAVAATMLSGPLFLAAVPSGTAAPEVPTTPRPVATAEVRVEMSALLARDEASASRGLTRAPVAPAPLAPEAPAAPAVPEPVAAEPVAPAPLAPEPVVVVEPPPPAVVGQLWATTDVNVRTGPTSGTERIGSVAASSQVDVTGATGDGWTQVVVDGRVGWVNSSYLAATQPQPAPAPEAAPQAAAAVSDASCSINPGIESNLSGNARAVYRAVCAAHGGSVSSFGGYRPGDGGDHGSGRAVDVMVSGEAGWEISRFLQARAGELGITYVIYEQQIWMAGEPAGAWEYMEDRGGATANHYDHVHVSVR